MRLLSTTAIGMLALVTASAQQQVVQQPGSPAVPLELIVKTDRETYKPGQWVTVMVYVRNTGPEPVVIMKPIHDGAVAGTVRNEVRLGDVPVRRPMQCSMFQGQVMMHNDVTEDRFDTIAPGETVWVYWEKFRERWDPRSKSRSPKDGYTKRLPLEPGTYTIHCLYVRREGRYWLPSYDDSFDFSGDAERLFEAAFKGELTAETQFRVTPK
jgi:hypothetical protein